MKGPHLTLLALLTLLVVPAGAIAQESPGPQSPPPPPAEQTIRQPTPFDQGRFRVSLTAGSGGSFNNRYVIIGAGGGYFIFDGFEAGLTVETWLGASPNITKLRPELRYIFFQVPYVHPYLGAFYQHWFISAGFDDADSVGGRAGIAVVTAANIYLGGGAVFEQIISECDVNCSEWYPEIFVSAAF